jgi:hypothetical protein
VDVSCGGRRPQRLWISVFDNRAFSSRTLPTFDFPHGKREELEVRLVEERYGGRSADTPETGFEATVLSDEDSEADPFSESTTPRANYEIPAITVARELFRIVDNWQLAGRMARRPGAAGSQLRGLHLEDGRFLCKAWRMRGERLKEPKEGEASAYLVAAHEMEWRIEHAEADHGRR